VESWKVLGRLMGSWGWAWGSLGAGLAESLGCSWQSWAALAGDYVVFGYFGGLSMGYWGVLVGLGGLGGLLATCRGIWGTFRA
jgi:hypothetical protein